MPESFTAIPGGTAPAEGTALPEDAALADDAAVVQDQDAAAALAAAAGKIARLDQALTGHPLLPALLHRARLEAVRRQAAVDGQAIDPWHLAALLEGLRLRMAGPRIIDRGMVFEAARHALKLHQWLVDPDPAQESAIRQAERRLAQHAHTATPLLAAAHAVQDWLHPSQRSAISGQRSGEGGNGHSGPDGDAGDAAASGGSGPGAGTGRYGGGECRHGGGEGPGGGPAEARPPMRAALVRFWGRHGLLHAPVPLTGTAALRPGTPWEIAAWLPAFLHALAGEADDARQLLLGLERAWFAARRAVAGRRKNSRAAAAIDLLAATPLLSATTLARHLGMATNNAAALLESFRRDGLIVEVSHRAARRLYGLAGLVPLRDVVAPPRRKLPGRGPGRPPLRAEMDLPGSTAGRPSPGAPPLPPLTLIERRQFDYSDLDAAMAQAEQTIRATRRVLEQLVPPSGPGSGAAGHGAASDAAARQPSQKNPA